MNIQKLYYMCDNLGGSSSFKVYRGRQYLGEFTYMEIPMWLDKAEVRGFKIEDERNIILHIA